MEEIRPTQELSQHEEDGWQQEQQQAGMAAAATPRAPRALYMRRSSDVQPGLGGAAEAAKGDFSIYITGLPPTSTVTSVAAFFRWGGVGWEGPGVGEPSLRLSRGLAAENRSVPVQYSQCKMRRAFKK